VDLVTLALNLFTQGVESGLDFSKIDEVIECAEHCNRMPVPERHPYAGDMVFTAFSGSHQDAIKKGFAAQDANGLWEVPYLPIDPRDLGRTYEAVIRVNSQSGKGGVAYLLERDYGIRLPRPLQIEFTRIIQSITDSTGGEVSSAEIWEAFRKEYIDRDAPFAHRDHHDESTDESDSLTATIARKSPGGAITTHTIRGTGKGPIEAFIDGFRTEFGIGVRIVDYIEHAIGGGADASAVCFVEARVCEGKPVFGVGMHRNIVTASLNAIISAVNRAANN